MVGVLFCAACTRVTSGASESFFDFKKEEMMKSVSVFVCKVILVLRSELLRKVVLAVVLFVFVPCGCRSYAQPGETAAEGLRRHQRNQSINRQEMMADLDKLMLLDKPSKLTDKRIP
jgi:hypothetical protein